MLTKLYAIKSKTYEEVMEWLEKNITDEEIEVIENDIDDYTIHIGGYYSDHCVTIEITDGVVECWYKENGWD